MQLVLTHRILRRSAHGVHSTTVFTAISLISKICSPPTNLILNPRIKVSGFDTAESGKYLQATSDEPLAYHLQNIFLS
jgi:hypothetical protein